MKSIIRFSLILCVFAGSASGGSSLQGLFEPRGQGHSAKAMTLLPPVTNEEQTKEMGRLIHYAAQTSTFTAAAGRIQAGSDNAGAIERIGVGEVQRDFARVLTDNRISVDSEMNRILVQLQKDYTDKKWLEKRIVEIGQASGLKVEQRKRLYDIVVEMPEYQNSLYAAVRKLPAE